MIKPIPGWSWEEDFDADQKTKLATRIVGELDAHLGADPGPRVYAAAGHPYLSVHAASALEPLIREGSDLRTAGKERSDVYLTSESAVFTRILPIIFEWGPPEIVLIAIPRSAIGENDVDASILSILHEADAAGRGGVGMYFDSGDLMKMF